jgi:hypothetical protein
VPGVGVAKAVDVSVKKNLVRGHVLALKDGGKNVVLRCCRQYWSRGRGRVTDSDMQFKS